MNEPGGGVRGLGDQTPNLVVEARSTERGVLVKVPLEDQLGGLDGFGSQSRIRCESHTVVVDLEVIGRAESLPVKKFQRGVLHRRIDEREAWIEGSAEGGILVESQAGRKKKILANRQLILQANGGHGRRALVDQVRGIGLHASIPFTFPLL